VAERLISVAATDIPLDQYKPFGRIVK